LRSFVPLERADRTQDQASAAEKPSLIGRYACGWVNPSSAALRR
jgi:hypothetical protein